MTASSRQHFLLRQLADRLEHCAEAHGVSIGANAHELVAEARERAEGIEPWTPAWDVEDGDCVTV